jgi:hypothetical protein
MPSGVDYRQQLVSSDGQPRTFYIPRRSRSGGVEVGHDARNAISSVMQRNADVDYEEVVAEATTLDDVCRSTGWLTPCALWVDVEGASSEVLTGGSESLDRNVQLIFIEVERRAAWVEQWLVDQVRDHLGTRGFVPVARDRESEWQFNEVYVRSDALKPDLLSELGEYIADLVRGPQQGA